MYRNGPKRILDVVVSLLALILFAPLMFLLAVAIKTTDPGPVIFRQRRVGTGGSIFLLYKFRTMAVDTGDIPSDRLGEIEIRALGRFIRRTNMDELPQLWNILKGDMSLVGPRPPIPAQEELIELRRINGALACRPGLTGWAQVHGYDGMSVPIKAGYDGEYARDVSLGKDVTIILRTFGYLMKPPPKY